MSVKDFASRKIKVIGFLYSHPLATEPLSQALFTCISRNMATSGVVLSIVLALLGVYFITPGSTTCLVGCSCTDDSTSR